MYVNDYKFVLQLAKQYEYFFISEPLVKYRIHGKNITLRDNAGWLKDFDMFGAYLLEEYKDDLTPRAKAKFLFKIAANAFSKRDLTRGRKYTLKAIANRPFRSKYWQSLVSSFLMSSNI